MDVLDAITRKPYVTGVPIVRGENPCADLLDQFAYKGIGKVGVIKITDNPPTDRPDAHNLGVEYTLVWGDDTRLEVGNIALGSKL